jgi:hypothetical protein
MADDFPNDEDARTGRGGWFFRSMGVPPGSVFPAGVHAPSLAFAQAAPPDAPGRRWIPYGARNIGGRVRAMAQDPTDARILYAGSGSGGLHRSTDGADTWAPVGGVADVWAVGAIAVAPSDRRVIVVGSGETITENVANIPPPAVPGLGIFRSVDAAATAFTTLVGPPPIGGGAAPAGACTRVAAIAIDPEHPHRFWAATDTGLWRWEPTAHNAPAATPPDPPGAFQADGLIAGFYTDVIVFGDPDEVPGPGGTHRFLIIIAGRNDGTVHRAKFDRTNPIPALGWVPIVTNLPANSNRIALAYCRTIPKFVYAVSAVGVAGTLSLNSSPLAASTDGGKTFVLRSQTEPPQPPPPPDPTTQAWYSLCLACHPTDPNVVVQGCLEVWRTTNGGLTPFTRILDWTHNNDGVDLAQHADEHFLMFDREDRNRLWLGNDGGISMAPDVTADPTVPKRYWRKRSHGLQLAQFNDITVHPVFPYIAGGGLQDNGTWAGVGGRTWLHIGKGDGGALCYEPSQARAIATTWTFGSPVMMTAVDPGGAPPKGNTVIINDTPDLPASPRNAMNFTTWLPGAAPFVGLIEQVQTNQILVARTGGVSSWNPSTGVNNAIATATPIVNAVDFSALAVAPTHPTTHWWMGNAAGEVFMTTTGTANPAVSVTAALIAIGHVVVGLPVAAPSAIGRHIADIAVNPRNRNCVAIATGGDGTVAGAQGHVYLTLDGGANWRDISGLGGGADRALPPCPTIALAWDPTPAIGAPQILYAGTLVGVWKLAGLPAANVAALPPPFPVVWNTFGNLADPAPGSEGKLALLMINDLVVVRHPSTPGSAAGAYEHAERFKLIAASFGRGMFECDLGVAANVPRHRLFIRQNLIEDGMHYPRPTAATLNTAFNPAAANLVNEMFHLGGDPRFPASPTPPAALVAGGVRFQPNMAYDIRVDNRTALFKFFEDRIDGVEFDDELGVDNLLPVESNAVYVQVHNRGTHTITDVEILLFFASTTNVSPLPAVPNLPTDFWARFRLADPMPPPAAAAVPAGAADWRRIGRRTGLTVPPGDPLVVRFDFVPAQDLAERNVALLALTLSPGNDLLGGPPAPTTNIGNLIRDERRAALRRVPVARLDRRVYIRDGIEDSGASVPAVAYGVRSPDIIVGQMEVEPVGFYADLVDRHPTDRVTGAADNFVYVRVFNPTGAPVRAQVELWSAPASDPAASPSDNTRWAPVPQRTPPAGAPPAPPAPRPDTIDIPARGVAYARFIMRNVPDPTPAASLAASSPHRAMFLAALVHAERTVLPGASPAVPVFETPIPGRAGARDSVSFLRFFRALTSSGRAAMRVLPHVV